MEPVKQPYQTPLLFPYEPELFWKELRKIIHEEIQVLNAPGAKNIASPPGLEYKPLYKIEELCVLFSVSKPTIYEWIKSGLLKPFKIRSRVYFLWNDVSSFWTNNK